MLTPEQLQKIADTMFPMLDDLNARILRDMIKRLAARIGRGEGHMLTATDEWQAQVYQESGGLLEDVQREIQQFLQASDEEMARIFEDAAIKSLEADNRVYVQAGDRARSLSPAMLRVLTDTYQRTKGTVHNFTRTTATETQKEFIRLLDEAHLRVMSGAGAYTQAVSDVMRELCETQTQVRYPSGHVDTIEVAVLRAVRTGTAQAAGNMSLTDMEERGWDLIRVSAHIGARYGDGGENPGNHFWWQGKLYSRSGNDKRYPPFIATTGYGTGEGLCGWNCRHSFGPGDPNHNPFKDFDAEKNQEAYDLSQRQRELERRIRHTKTKLIGLREGIDATEDAGVKASLETEYAKTAKLLERQNEAYNKFCDDNKLKRLAERIEVAKWTRADAKKSMMAVEGSASAKGSANGAESNDVASSPGEGVAPKDAPEQQAAESAPTDTMHGHSLDGYTPEQQQEIRRLLDNAPQAIRDLYAKYGNQLQAVNEYIDPAKESDAYFDHKDERVHMRRADTVNGNAYQTPYQRHFHEYAHNLDWLAGKRQGKRDSYSAEYLNADRKSLEQVIMDDWETSMKKYYKGTLYDKNSVYLKIFEKNVEETGANARGYVFGLLNKLPEQSGPYVSALKAELYPLKSQGVVREFYLKHVDKLSDLAYDKGATVKTFKYDMLRTYGLPSKVTGNLSDLFERFSFRAIGGEGLKPFGVGHKKEYALKDGNLSKEAFAEMLDAAVTNPDALALIKQYLPNAYATFLDILKGMIV